MNHDAPPADHSTPKQQLLGRTRAQLREILHTLGVTERYRADQLFRWLYAKRARTFVEMTDLPKLLLAKLDAQCYLDTIHVTHESVSADGTRKFLFQLSDGRSIETVLIPSEMLTEGGEPARRTLCVSTQVGCPLDCKFCATASLKLKRNLTTAEILLQIFEAERQTGEAITNLVYMGMGEPMLNYENVVRSLRIITDPEAEMLGRRRITVSTSGLPNEIVRFAGEGLHVKLALSLHATTDELRTRLMPINKRYPIESVLNAMEEYYRATREPVTYEYIVFDGLNDSEDDAKRLAKITRRMPSKVNVIPFHPIDFTDPHGLAGELRPAPQNAFEQFLRWLRREGVQVMVRSSSGKDIEAACGQLALAHLDEISQPIQIAL